MIEIPANRLRFDRVTKKKVYGSWWRWLLCWPIEVRYIYHYTFLPEKDHGFTEAAFWTISKLTQW